MNACLLALSVNQWLLIGIIVVVLIAVVALSRNPRRGIHGSPSIKEFPCAGNSLIFKLEDGSEVPAKIYAVIYCGLTEPLTWDPLWEHTVNYGTHPTYTLTGVVRTGSGLNCSAKVWCCYTTPPPECKEGTQNTCELGSGSGSGFVKGSRGGGGGSSAAMFRLAPQHYLLSVGQLLQSDADWLREAAGDHPLNLAYQPDQSHGQCAVWRTTNGSALACELLVVKEGDSEPRAELTVAPKSNGSTAESVRWSTDYWSFTGINRLVAAQHTPESAYPQTVTVSPA